MRSAWKILTPLLVVILTDCAWAANTGKIAGRVMDAKTGEGLIGVNVILAGTKQGAMTDRQGDYFIINVDPGTYDVKASQVGFNEVVVQGVRVRVDATTEVNFQMEETVLEIGQEVVVTAQRPLVQKDNTATRSFVESSEIQNLPATSVGEVVQTVPSIDVVDGALRVRGGGLNEVSFLIDGARARNPNNQVPYTNINLSSVQELEVITGPYSAEYGEARSGVLNIITKEGGKNYSLYFEGRYTPPGVKHWGPSLYDQSTPIYWENTHARHMQWWIDNPDMWVDPNGRYGNDPLCSLTPEQAYGQYIATHQPLTDYTKRPSYSVEMSLGGPVPEVEDLWFFVSGKYRSDAPLMGNAYRNEGKFFDGTAKLSFQLTSNIKVLISGFLGTETTSWGISGGPDYFWAGQYGIDSRYAYYDWEGVPTIQTNGQTVKWTHVLDQSSLYEVKLSRVYARRQTDVFPDDPLGWDASDATRDNLRAYEIITDSTGNSYRTPVKGGYLNRVGFHTTGYYFRYNDRNTDWTFSGYYSNQITKNFSVKTGGEFTYYSLEHFNESKAPPRTDDRTYNPYQGALYAQTKMEFGGFIMNAGLRFDIYNPNDVVYTSLFDPLNGPTEQTSPFTQLSPRLGISHPIDEYTVLHFSYGHFFQRGPFFDYGEGNSEDQALGNLTTFIVSGTTNPWVLGNRNVKPEKTIQYEVGIERNFFEEIVLGLTAYYKDIRNTLRVVSIEAPGIRYSTNGNGDYGDVRGIEISLRKQATRADWGATWGFLNFTTQIGISGKSGDPYAISPTQVLYPPSGDVILHENPRLKAALYYETPSDWKFLGGALSELSATVEYTAVFANDERLGDYFEYGGQKYTRPADQNTNLKLRKYFSVGVRLRLGFYAEIRNLFNNRWLYFHTFESASLADQKQFVDSNFEYLPTVDNAGAPILELAMYRNLPRSVIFGLNMEF